MAGDGFLAQLEHFFATDVVGTLSQIIFFDVAFWSDEADVPLVVLWLMIGAVYFTLRFHFVNLRGFRHSLDCVLGRYTRADETGEISHFQGLSGALSGTTGS